MVWLGIAPACLDDMSLEVKSFHVAASTWVTNQCQVEVEIVHRHYDLEEF